MCFDICPIIEAAPPIRKCWVLFFKDIDTAIFFVSYSRVEIADITRAILKDWEEFNLFWKLESSFFPSFKEVIRRLVADIISKEETIESLILGS